MRRFATVLGLILAALIPCGGATADEPATMEQTAATPAKGPDGKPVFQKFKCNSCHSIATQGITKKPTEGEEEGAPKQKPPDLSGVGVARKAEWIGLFLQKKEKIDGRLHGKKFRGTDSELQKLAGWLATLKDEAAAKKMKAGELSPGGKKAEAKTEEKGDVKSAEKGEEKEEGK